MLTAVSCDWRAAPVVLVEQGLLGEGEAELDIELENWIINSGEEDLGEEERFGFGGLMSSGEMSVVTQT